MGNFEYLRAPYGIQSIPSCMQRVINHILSENDGPLMKYALAYLDDILLFDTDLPTHLEHLEEVFKRLRKSQLKLNPSKCRFVQNEVIFLGNRVTAEGVGPDPNKIKAILECPAPKR